MEKVYIIDLGLGYKTKVTDATFFRLGLDRLRWGLQRFRDGRVYVSSTNGSGSLHRLLTGAKRGQVVDHRNHDTLDNTDENLRLCTSAQNRANSLKDRDNQIGYKGVWRPKTGGWAGQIVVNGKKHHLGVYDSPLDAARAHDRAALQHHGEFACLNFPAGDYAGEGVTRISTGRRKPKNGYRGVAWMAKCNRWIARITAKGKVHYLGLYADKHRAARAYDRRARELFGEFAHCNFTDAEEEMDQTAD